MRSDFSIQSATVSDVSDNSDDELEHPRRISPLELAEPEKNCDLLLAALVKGKNKTYLERVKLAFQSTFLSLPLFFINGSFIFFSSKKRLASNMEANLYYHHYFPKLISVFSLEGAIVSSEAVAITTPTVILAGLVVLLSLSQQSIKYLFNYNQRQKLHELLSKNKYSEPSKINAYSLTATQLDRIRLLLECDGFDEETVISAEPSALERFASDLLWVNEEADKYIAPFLLLSLIPGFLLMFRSAQDLDQDMDCSMFVLWSLFFNVCPPIQKIEVMSLLSYIWGCFSGTLLASHSLAITTRVALSPFPTFRSWFNEKINQPFATWWGANKLYDQLIHKMLLSTIMPVLAGYSLYTAFKFTNQYLKQTGCGNIGQALEKVGLGGAEKSAYPCSTTQVSLGGSALIGDFEFNHVYPSYLSIGGLTTLLAFGVKRYPYFKKERVLEKAKQLLASFAPIERNLMISAGIGAVAGGLAGIWPALHISNTILQKEGFEIFFPLNNLTANSNVTLPDNLHALPIPLEELMANTPDCSIDSTIQLPDTSLGNATFPSLNASFPCIETLYDASKNTTIIGLQLTPPCPSSSIHSAFYRHLLHFHIPCDFLLVVRAFGSFVVSYWVTVNTGIIAASTLGATVFFAHWAAKKSCSPAQAAQLPITPCEKSDLRRNYSPRLFTASPNSHNLHLLTPLPEFLRAQDSDDSDDEFEAVPQREAGCLKRLLTRFSGLFGAPQEAQKSTQKPLLEKTREYLSPA